jgi:CheY-like chemotaxis protein
MSATLGIIKSHDGILQLSSEPGIGTTFKVYLPVPAVPVIADARPATSQTLAAKIKGTILLVDDEQELRTLGAIRLKKIGFSTITAADGLEALDIYRQQQDEIDLILLDLLMPEMDGTETYHCLREIPRTVPIVFCSGCSIKELSVNILDDEQTGFLKKPYKPDQLQTILLEILK